MKKTVDVQDRSDAKANAVRYGGGQWEAKKSDGTMDQVDALIGVITGVRAHACTPLVSKEPPPL